MTNIKAVVYVVQRASHHKIRNAVMPNHVPIIHLFPNISSISFLITTLIYDSYYRVLLFIKVKSNYCDDKVDLKGLRNESDVDALLRCHGDEIVHLDGVNNDSYDGSIDSHSVESDK
jgi:hypothetical protein